MVGEYYNLMNELKSVCEQMVDSYQHLVESTVQRVVHGAALKKLPF